MLVTGTEYVRILLPVLYFYFTIEYTHLVLLPKPDSAYE
jgi:hypothetical protein